ncbi:MAG: helix-turn-helix domain-containing protein [bacterium]
MLRRLRSERGLNQEQLAAKLGVRQEWVSRYEVGERRLDVVELADIASALGVTIPEILRDADIGHGAKT